MIAPRNLIAEGSESVTSPQPEYRTIPGYDGYLAGSNGTIIGRWGRPLSQYTDRDGYKRVSASREHGKDVKRSQRGVHVFVCLAFHGERPSLKHEVRHLDGTRDHNEPHNLCWATRKENSDDRIVHGTVPCGTKTSLAKLTDEQVREIRAIVSTQHRRKSAYSDCQVAKRYGVSNSTIRLIRIRKIWRHL